MQTPSFILRKFDASDATSIAYHANHFESWVNLKDVFPYPYTIGNAEDFIQMAQGSSNTIYAIEVQGKAIGAIGMHMKDDVFKYSGEVGYWIGPDFQIKGIITKALACMVKEAFEKYNLLRLYAKVFEGNEASGRVLEKVGFSLTARLEKAVYKNRQVKNLLVYSIINSNWNPPID